MTGRANLVWILLATMLATAQSLKPNETPGTKTNPDDDTIPGEFIIAVDKSVAEAVGVPSIGDVAKEVYALQVRKELNIGSTLYLVVAGSASDVAAMAERDDVRYTEPNRVVHALYMPYPVCNSVSIGSELWGLARINQRESLSGTFEYSIGDLDDGDGVTAYVVDSGVEIGHTEFSGRATHGFTSSEFTNNLDRNGHGTHVAGIIGGGITGVAKEVSIVAVKVLGADGSGMLSGILEGFDWILRDFVNEGQPKSVINLSLGLSTTSDSFDDALNEVINSGIPAVAAAGNDYGVNACYRSPARVPNAVTVGATTKYDYVADFSNVGTCVDIFAPGEQIYSAYKDRTYATASGTSQATPHVAGVIARYLSTLSSRPSPSSITDWLLRTSTKRAIAYADCPDRLLYAQCYTGGEWSYDTGDDMCGACQAKIALGSVILFALIARFLY